MNSKKLLQSSQLLVYYDPRLPLFLTCDASPYGVGAVLSHRVADSEERPIAYASRTLSVAEKKYAQIEKEGLAVMFGLQRFHKYLYGRNFYHLGRKFTIYTDHKPLVGLLREGVLIPPMASARVQGWGLKLSNYDNCLKYRAGRNLSNADCLSRLPIQTEKLQEEESQEVILDSILDDITRYSSYGSKSFLMDFEGSHFSSCA